MTRHASVHAAGVVIAPKAITEYAPLYKGARDEIVTQWSMKEIERVGLLKMDFLGLSTLTLIFDAIAEIERTTGDRARHRRDRRSTMRRPIRFSRTGRPTASSSSSRSGMRDILRKAKPQRLEDLIALNALLSARPAAQRAWSTTTSRASRARPRSATSCRSSSRSWPKPTASSRIRNR